MTRALTTGPHHIGLTTSRLEDTAAFFINLLNWKEVKRNDEYPAIFVSDGAIMLTLWAAKDEPVIEFNRRANIGLHHLALRVENEAALLKIYDRLEENGVRIEFAPELLKGGPAKHMMCYEPGGIRIEFIWPAN